LLLCAAFASSAFASEPERPISTIDATLLETIINESYAYLDRFDDQRMPMTETLRIEAAAVETDAQMTRFGERALLLLADHHAITSSSLKDSWGVSGRSDLWIELVEGEYLVTSVRALSPAEKAGVRAGDVVTAVGGLPIHQAVATFWADLGVTEETDAERNAFAARVLATGRRDRARDLSFSSRYEGQRRLSLPNLYSIEQPRTPLVSANDRGQETWITFHDSLYDNATLTAFDEVMAEIPRDQPLVLDLTNTASGGNTTVARAILGWFTMAEQPYQVHSLPAEFRRFGVERKWRELVMPREGKYHEGPVEIRVGRWTGSMGEGIALGMDALGYRVCGTKMAGLLGAVYTLDVPTTKLRINLPVERLEAVDGTPREDLLPEPCAD
jgi:carboxyl-terminal processing protease